MIEGRKLVNNISTDDPRKKQTLQEYVQARANILWEFGIDKK